MRGQRYLRHGTQINRLILQLLLDFSSHSVCNSSLAGMQEQVNLERTPAVEEAFPQDRGACC